MRETDCQVFLIARPALDPEGLRGYLEAAGGASWLERRQGSDAEALVEFAGRACYRSWEPGLLVIAEEEAAEQPFAAFRILLSQDLQPGLSIYQRRT